MPDPNPTSRREALFLENLALIERVIRFAAGRQRLSASEIEDLEAIVKLRLIENDYEVLARWEGRSNLATYLTTVVQRLILDERTKRWGRYRPSAEARRAGAVACELERLLTRDGYGMEQAFEVLLGRFPELDREQLHRVALRLPPRVPRRFVPEEEADGVPTAETAEEAMTRRELGDVAEEMRGALGGAIDQLDPQDRLVLRLRYEQGFAIVDIAKTIGIPAKPLYKRVESLLVRLQRSLKAVGFDKERALEVLALGGFDVEARENGRFGPSLESRAAGSGRERVP